MEPRSLCTPTANSKTRRLSMRGRLFATQLIAVYIGSTRATGRFLLQLVAVVLVLHAPLARAASICRWVDESGRTHLSDVVPEKFRQTARRSGASMQKAWPASAPIERPMGSRSRRHLTYATTFPVLKSSVVHDGTESTFHLRDVWIGRRVQMAVIYRLSGCAAWCACAPT